MSQDEPPMKKQKEEPTPPAQPFQMAENGEGIAVVAEEDLSVDSHSAFRKRLQRFDIKLENKAPDLKKFLEEFHKEFEKILKESFKENKGIKVYLVLTVSYLSTEFPDRVAWTFYLGTSGYSITEEGQIPDRAQKIYLEIERRNDNLVSRKTGLVIETLHWATIFISKYIPMAGRCIVKLPKFLDAKKAIINIKNTDNRCFGYAILAHLHPTKKNPSYPIWYNKFFKQHGLDKITYPVTIDQIPEIEKKLNLRINVFSFFDDEGKGRFPKYIGEEGNYNDEVNLLYWNEHYALISQFSRFIADIHWSHRKKEFCKKYFGVFNRKSD